MSDHLHVSHIAAWVPVVTGVPEFTTQLPSAGTAIFTTE